MVARSWSRGVRAVLVMALARAVAGAALLVLRPGAELLGLEARSGDALHVALAGPLASGAANEARVSYLATSPCEFSWALAEMGEEEWAVVSASVALESAAAEAEAELEAATQGEFERGGLRRRRLNTERFRVETNAQGRVVLPDGRATERAVLVVTALSSGVPAPGLELRKRLLFNLALDRLVFLVLPAPALRMVAWGALSAALALGVLAPAMERLLGLPSRPL
jgi:hypothetical protein